MPLLLLLPLVISCIYGYALSKLVKNKNALIKQYIFLITTPLIFSFIEASVIYHFHGYDDVALSNNIYIFVLIIALNSVCVFLKLKAFDKKDIQDVVLKSSLYDGLCVVGFILTLIFFR